MKIQTKELQKGSLMLLFLFVILYLPIYITQHLFGTGFLQWVTPLAVADLFLSVLPFYGVVAMLILLLGINLYRMKKENKISFTFIVIYGLLKVAILYGAFHCESVVNGWMSV